jgi:hypothetical protein
MNSLATKRLRRDRVAESHSRIYYPSAVKNSWKRLPFKFLRAPGPLAEKAKSLISNGGHSSFYCDETLLLRPNGNLNGRIKP